VCSSDLLKTEMKKVSEQHYKRGVMFYLKEDLNGAVSEWRQALALDPENAKIKNDIENALQLIKKIDKIK
jgi:Tfp pilus assembly protein PilF